jgi:pseudaminic acid biosynthesis-associated methylase
MEHKSAFLTEQEEFWAGEFGNQYITRNQNPSLISSNVTLFSKILSHTQAVHSVLELGANIGLNLKALRTLLPEADLVAVEINSKAVEHLKQDGNIQIYHQSILTFTPTASYDFVLVKGVLIHLNPDYLAQVYELLFQASARYICIAEYYNPTPVEVSYRRHEGKLFKRDFAGELLDRFNQLQLVEYGFVYHRDNQFPQDDITWFLLEKVNQ